jgi:hypothetical protein
MEPVMLVEVLDVHGQVRFQHRRNGAGQQLTIGRSLTCDIVLDDPYAATEHARLQLQDDGRVQVEDLKTRNGTRVQGKRIDVAQGQSVQDAELIIGRTRLRVRGNTGELPAERVFSRNLLRRRRMVLAMTGLALCLAFAVFLQWLTVPERLAPRALVAVLATCAVLAPWVFVWALVSRLTHGEWRVRVHLAIASLAVAIGAWGYWACGIIAFAFQWHWLPVPMTIAAGLLAFAMTWMHLRYATNIRSSVAAGLALLAPPLLIGLWWLVGLQRDPPSVNRLALGPDVQPSALRLAPSTDLADYLSDFASLKRAARDNRQASLLEDPLADADTDGELQPEVIHP